MKTQLDWKEEAESFITEWENATGRKPTLEDVKEECRTIEDIENPDEYAEILFSYM